MTNSRLLKEIISKSGLKMERLADLCGITRQSLTNKINNRSSFTAREIDILCKALKITSLSEKERIFFVKKVE